MNLGNLAGLWLWGLIVPLLLMYILKVRRPRRVVSSVWLWRAAERDLQAKHPFRKLRAQVPLLLQLLVLSLLGLALAEPFSKGADPLLRHVVIVLDVSASMNTVENGTETRMELARQAAASQIDALDPGAEVMLLTAGKTATVVTPFERDRRRLRRALSQVSAQHVEGDLSQAVSLAASRLRSLQGQRRLVIVTDGALADQSPIVTGDVATEVVRVGEPKDNLAITRINVEREVESSSKQLGSRSGTRSNGSDSAPKPPATADPRAGSPADGAGPGASDRFELQSETSTVHVFVSVKNFGRRVRNVYATLRQRNVQEPLASRQVQLQPGEEAPVVLSFEAVDADAGTGISVELSPNDALAVDDRAFALVPDPRRQTVILSPADKTPWLRRALLADPDVELLGIAADALETARVPPGALIVYAGRCPERTPKSGYLIIDPPAGECLGDVIQPAPEGHQITQWNDADPRLRFLSLVNLRARRANTISTNSPQRVLVESQHGALVVKQELFGREGTLVAFEFGETDWPLKASFVLFVRNLVEVARLERHRIGRASIEPGQPLRLSVPTEIDAVVVEAPEKEAAEIRAKDGVAVLPLAEKSGFYFFAWEGEVPGSVLLPSNLTSPRESDLSAAKKPNLFAGAGSRVPAEAPVLANWSWVLAAMALAFLLADVWCCLPLRRSSWGQLRFQSNDSLRAR